MFEVTKKEKMLAQKVINLLQWFQEESNSALLIDQASELIDELEKSLD